MPVRRDGAAATFLLALSTREGAFLLEKGSTILFEGRKSGRYFREDAIFANRNSGGRYEENDN